MKINEIIKVARDKRGMAQSELALRIGKSTRMIQKYESGEVIPNLEVLSEIAKALGIESEVSEIVSQIFKVENTDCRTLNRLNIAEIHYNTGDIDNLIVDENNRRLLEYADPTKEVFVMIKVRDAKGLSTTELNDARECGVKIMISSIQRIKFYELLA